ncbi:uncharacterized protein EDB93DRAFT_1099618 [Suillus bovinus]|uniref:uncharacterized protein n=1 Tax=Suillus bovinus TaxID=48563 RepID=UPI001B86C0A8|nr:uncharacterized protein EDB93DRAFT_1099618 [Suillus bovinus]KAG2159208.1 hypothetical protein EDB93DRAFT_1099618 [Suillus bovinus]
MASTPNLQHGVTSPIRTSVHLSSTKEFSTPQIFCIVTTNQLRKSWDPLTRLVQQVGKDNSTIMPWRQSYIEEVYALPSPFIKDAHIHSITCLDPSFVNVDHQTLKTAIIYSSMAPSTRTKVRRGATTTGTTGPTVSDSSVMHTRSGITINPPTDQDNKRKRRTIHQLSPVLDNPNHCNNVHSAGLGTSYFDTDVKQYLSDALPTTPTRVRQSNPDPTHFPTVRRMSDPDPTHFPTVRRMSDPDPTFPRIAPVLPMSCPVASIPTRIERTCSASSTISAEPSRNQLSTPPKTSSSGLTYLEHDLRRLCSDPCPPSQTKTTSATDNEDDGMGDVGNNDDHDKNPNEGNDQADEDEEKEGEDEEGKDEENEDKENQDSGCAKTSPVRRLRARKVKMVNYNFDDGSPTSSSDSSYISSHTKREDLIKFPPTSQMQMKTSTTTHSADDHTPAGIVFGPTPDNEPTENEEELPGNLKQGRLCQEGIDEAQELGCKTAEEAWVIGIKYGKSTRTILIEAGLSIKHSRSESDWNAHQCWFMDNNPCDNKESIVDWKERQHTHYHAMGKDNEQWDTIRKYSITGSNIDQLRAKTILSMREDIARKLSAYSHLEGVEAVGCIFDTTQDEAARQVSGFVAGSDLIVKLINEHQLDARAILDWVMTATKVKGYNISIPHRENLSQHLKLLVVPFIKCKAHSYYEAELRTEAENLFEIERKKSKGKRRGQERTVEDVMSELDVDVPEIEFTAWPDECLKQLSDEVPEMFDIPLVTSTLDVVLRKLADSAKFKASIPEDMLAVHEAHLHGPIPSTAEILPGGHESSSPTLSSPALPSNQRHTTTATPVRRQEGSHPTRLPDLLDHESHSVRPTTRGELTGGGPQQANMSFKVKKTLRVKPTLAWRMEEHPTRSHNATDLECEPYPRREDMNFIASNLHQEYLLSPPVYPERAKSSHARYYQPTYRPHETTPSADNGDYSHPQHHYSRRHNWDDDQSQRFQRHKLLYFMYLFTSVAVSCADEALMCLRIVLLEKWQLVISHLDLFFCADKREY